MTATITTLDEFEREFRDGLGVPLTPRAWRTVTPEWVQRFSDGVGDYNPLYRDEEYADTARFHQLVASPAFIFSINFGAMASIWGHLAPGSVPMNALTILYGGARIQWHRPIWVGDRVRAIETPEAITRKSLRQIPEALVCTGRTEYFNHRGEKIATLHNDMLRFPNQGRGVEAAPRDLGEQIAPDPLVWSRERRGSAPLYGAEVAVGDELPELAKGTFTRTELYLFAHGALSTKRAAKVAPGAVDVGAGGRADPEYARRERAQEGSFDFGPQRFCWMIQLVTDWMGDHGTLESFTARLHRPNIVGDTNRVRGRVTGIRREGDTFVAEVAVEVLNQSDATTTAGTATVRLPSDGAGLDHEILFTKDVASNTGMYG
ncbi:MaoC family dehydratase N-terminal domain-containing protein [Microbacterium sp. zg-Y818]|uniref:FAS1-like dehydratase domain-containing protein n=1 Tax=unclassified Microbacterium TaxID=2609290 RepID=UPI00214BB0D5|nr:MULTISPECIES: MaoC family dehydratase N-terminal domain-containing protein [unclassified Microbacterium]MCR2799303.1 MaoC family dehydratase N-terminal domain-containing protein [Microbacterium sp. zg.Y818]WIM21304.1 MaoC family dehydratase N-terminal domain-containing protein [Microbacterium sp. zg-Y818]